MWHQCVKVLKVSRHHTHFDNSSDENFLLTDIFRMGLGVDSGFDDFFDPGLYSFYSTWIPREE
jgi:hypothetical protein